MMNPESNHTISDRAASGLMALVAGDAMGFDVRTRPPRGNGGSLVPRGPWSLQAALALATAASLAERGWDLDDMMARFWRCWDRGDETADGRTLGAGPVTREAILRFGSGAGVLEAGVVSEDALGCGALPRLYPVALHAAAEEPEEALLRCRDAASLTHANDRVSGVCVVYGLILRGLLHGASLESAVERALSASEGWVPEADRSRIRDAIGGTAPPEATGSEAAWSDPADCALAAGIWCVARHREDPDGAIDAAVERPGRAEVVAAIAGSLIGVRSGLAGLPEDWLDALPRREWVRERALAFGAAVERRMRNAG